MTTIAEKQDTIKSMYQTFAKDRETSNAYILIITECMEMKGTDEAYRIAKVMEKTRNATAGTIDQLSEAERIDYNKIEAYVAERVKRMHTNRMTVRITDDEIYAHMRPEWNYHQTPASILTFFPE
jgi:hypothetical protein